MSVPCTPTATAGYSAVSQSLGRPHPQSRDARLPRPGVAPPPQASSPPGEITPRPASSDPALRWLSRKARPLLFIVHGTQRRPRCLGEVAHPWDRSAVTDRQHRARFNARRFWVVLAASAEEGRAYIEIVRQYPNTSQRARERILDCGSNSRSDVVLLLLVCLAIATAGCASGLDRASWPQVGLLLVLVADLILAVRDHGRPRTGKNSVWGSVIGIAVILWLSASGGFFVVRHG